MAKFQFSISQTITMDTADWPQRGRDRLAAELEKQGWRRDNGMVPTAAMHDDAIRVLIDEDKAFLDHIRHDMRKLETKDVKIVCIDREFDPGTPLSIPAAPVPSQPTEGQLKTKTAAEIAAETAAKVNAAHEEANRARAQTHSGTSEVAKHQQQPDEGAKGTIASQASARLDTVNPNPNAAGKGDSASTSKEQPKNPTLTQPAPKIDDSKAGAIQGARDSTQKK